MAEVPFTRSDLLCSLKEDDLWLRKTKVDTLKVNRSSIYQAGGKLELCIYHWNCKGQRTSVSKGTNSSLLQLVPGGVTNTSGTFFVPAALVNVALYVPAVAELVVMVRVKLKEVVLAGALEQGLPMV